MDKKLKLKTELAKKLKKETSVTGTGASVTPGTGAGVATKYAFGKRDNKGTPSDWKSAPSIPNRKSKAMDYKELWEEAGTDEVVAVLNNPNLDPDVKKTLMSAYRQKHITADGVLAIVDLVLKKGSINEGYEHLRYLVSDLKNLYHSSNDAAFKKAIVDAIPDGNKYQYILQYRKIYDY